MNNLEIRFSRPEEYNAIKNFLVLHWDKEFAVVKSKELFDFLYLQEDRINFILAIRGDKIVALLGVIFYASDEQDIFLALWRSIDDIGNAGIELINFVSKQGYGNITSVGVRKEVLAVYQLLGFKTGKMDHYVKINDSMSEFKILSNVPEMRDETVCKSFDGVHIKEINQFATNFKSLNNQKQLSPVKSIEYLNKRYFNHTHYKYRVFEIQRSGEVINYFVLRKIVYEGAWAIRLIDCLNYEKGFLEFSEFLTQLLKDWGAEYVDIYCSNMDKTVLEKAGFIDRSMCQNLIVPNYFEPFKQQNEDKYYITTYENPQLYKGDGDADRPYRL